MSESKLAETERTRLLDVENGGGLVDYSGVRGSECATSRDTLDTYSQSSGKSDVRDIFEVTV